MFKKKVMYVMYFDIWNSQKTEQQRKQYASCNLFQYF